MILLLSLGCCLVAAAVILFLQRVISLSRVPAYTLVLGFLAFFLPASNVIILSLDLAYGAQEAKLGSDEATLELRLLRKLWRSEYWISFALTMTLLPLMQSFVESGYILDFSKRLRTSLRENLRWQALYLGIGSLGLFYILVTTRARVLSSPQAFKGFLIALANTWGLFLALTFMGHGLVGVPRRLWRTAGAGEQVAECEAKASALWQQLEHAREAEAQAAAEIVQLEPRAATDRARAWLAEMASLVHESVMQARARGPDARPGRRSFWLNPSSARQETSERSLTDEQLAMLTRRVRSAAERKDRFATLWFHLIQQYEASSQAELTQSTASRFPSQLKFLLQRTLAVALACLSASILWAELFINREEPFLRFLVIPISSSQGWRMELLSILLLTYMCTCTYSTLLRIKLFDRHALLDHQRTSQSSLFFYGSYCCRVTIPLSYNFISLLPSRLRSVSVFSQFLGSAIDLQPLGKAFNDWLPLYILVPVFLTLVDVKRLGLAWLQEEDDESAASAADYLRSEGRHLLRQHLAESHGLVAERWPADADTQSLQSPYRDEQPAGEAGVIDKTWQRWSGQMAESLHGVGDLFRKVRS